MKVRLTETVAYEDRDTRPDPEATALIDAALRRSYRITDRLATDVYMMACRSMPLALMFQSAADVAEMYPPDSVSVKIDWDKDIRRRSYVVIVELEVTTGQWHTSAVLQSEVSEFTRSIVVTNKYKSARLSKQAAQPAPVEPPKRRMLFRPKSGLKSISNVPPVKVGE